MSTLFGADRKAAKAQIKAAEEASTAQLQAQDKALAAQEKGFLRAQDLIGSLIDEDSQALNISRALTGALGPEAQQEAIANFQEDPGTQFIREQGERSIRNRAAATGGLGGPNLTKELIRFNQGLANQGLQQRIGNLVNIGNIDTGLKTSLANLATGQGAASAQGATNVGNILAGLSTTKGGVRAQRALNERDALASGLVGLGTTIASGGLLPPGLSQGLTAGLQLF